MGEEKESVLYILYAKGEKGKEQNKRGRFTVFGLGIVLRATPSEGGRVLYNRVGISIVGRRCGKRGQVFPKAVR